MLLNIGQVNAQLLVADLDILNHRVWLNVKVEELLACRFRSNKGVAWSQWLPEIQCKLGLLLVVSLISNYIICFLTDQLNTCIHETMKCTPYELVYGQPPRSSIFPGSNPGQIMEEDVADLLAEDDCISNSPLMKSKNIAL